MKFKARSQIFALLYLAISTISSHACAWDSDTLEAEAKGIPDTIRVISGRFERNPDLYYEMRLARVTKELGSTPETLELYDDAGVACDRLHRGDEAIAWMEKKRAQMERLRGVADAGVLREHRYRTLANLGTFIAHRWLRNGADRTKISEMKRGRDFIAAAIELNPDAHFGREKYQLKAMEWMISPPPKKKDSPTITSFIDVGIPADLARDAVEGLSGLIVLGDAWQSADIFHALAIALQADRQKTSVAYSSYLRCFELIDAGAKSAVSTASTAELKKQIQAGDYQVTSENMPQKENLELQFKELRAEADEWHAQRTAFMIERLKVGRHPDTDETFWNEWQEPAEPELYLSQEQAERDRMWQFLNIGAAVFGVLLVSFAALKFARRKKAG